jgi:hypothetical protein
MGFLDLIRKSQDVELDLRVDRAACLPGETVTATIAVSGKNDLAIEEGRAELVYENEYTYREMERDSADGYETEDETTTDRISQAAERFLEKGSVEGGTQNEYTIDFRIPNDAVPSGEGEITKVRWLIKGILSRHRARDSDADAAVTVLSPRERYASRAQRPPEAETRGDCHLELRLNDGKDLRAGDTVAGTLVVTPLSGIDADEVRIELVRHEEVPRGQGNEQETVEARTVMSEASELTGAAPVEYPFELTVPDVRCPSLETEQSSVRWYLRGVVARSLRFDYTIKQELNVYTARA